MAVSITGIAPGSHAARKGIRAGETLLCINGHPVEDVLDYRFYLMEPRLELEIEGEKGRRRVRIRKDETADIGLEFATYLMDRQRCCKNKCIFCFIDQMPPGMRESLYFKDDDSRLSFLFGNYITLTNLSEHDITRIIEMHISPLRVSVHTTNPALRCRMMNNRFAGDSLKALERFAQAGIRIEGQLVLCPGVNDGEELRRTMEDLSRMIPAVESVAAVPVGLTRYREGLTALRGYTAQEAAAVIDAVEEYGSRMLAQHGNRVFYPADEFYVKAGRALPEEDFYGDMAQLENGVGLIALLRAEFRRALDQCTGQPAGSRLILATGAAAAPFLRELIDEAKQRWHNLHVDVFAVQNHFFGETIDVAGLVTGRDIAEQLYGCEADCVLFPDVMLRHEGDRFLDDMVPVQLEEALGVPVRAVPTGGEGLLQALLL